MNETYCGITQLIKSALTEAPVAISENFDWKTAIDIAAYHKIEVLIYYGIYYSKISIPDEYKKVLEKCVFAQSNIDAQQEYEIIRLCEAFDNKNIMYMLLKGTLIKKIYPKPEMRYMGDADILIKTEEHSKIEAIMTEAGYNFAVESDHEYIWNKRNICVELHKRLIPSYNKDYCRCYGDGWQLAKLVDGKYIMSDEDFYIYLFTHIAKHYRDKGIGIKQFVDLWVQKNSVSLNEEYINAELKKLQLLEFHENCMQMIKVWFEGAKKTDITEYMTDFVFSSGVYGTQKTGELSAALKDTLEMKSTKNLKFKFYLKRIFLPYKHMKMKHPFLDKYPILLPIMWVVRIFSVILFKKERIKENINMVNRTTIENISKYEDTINYVGLKFDFKEKKL